MTSETAETPSTIQTESRIQKRKIVVVSFVTIVVVASVLSFYWLSRPPQTTHITWSKTYGGIDDDKARSVVQTNDGGYAVAGYTNSYGVGNYDFWLVKTDSAGMVQWNKTYGGTEDDRALSMVQTSDGGYALVGFTDSYGAGNDDFWLVKTDSAGNQLWNKTYEAAGDDHQFSSVVQTDDGGYAIAGFIAFYGSSNNTFISQPYSQAFLVKTFADGTVEWNKTYGGGGTDHGFAYSVVQTNDGGYALAGCFFHQSEDSDFWLIKTDSAGTVQWNRTYGATYGRVNNEMARSVVQTSDGGYILVGDTYLWFNDYDLWLIKTDSVGTAQWNKRYRGTDRDSGNSVVQTSDGGYALAASGFASFVETDANGNLRWSERDEGTALFVVRTSDGGYAFAGYTSPSAVDSDFWLVKIDAS